jgi:hypothetical protein
MNKLTLYIVRWQLSTPILYLVMALVKLPELEKVVLANLVGALVFYPIDNKIFKKGGGMEET